MLITDAQVHVWRAKPDLPEPQGPATGGRPNGHPPEELLKEMKEAGVDRVVIVPPGALAPLPEAQGYCDTYPGRFALVPSFDPEQRGSREQIPGWMSQSHVLGMRIGFSAGGRFKASFDDGTLDWFWDEAERLQIPLMSLVGAMSARVYPVVQKHPGLIFIVDHLGRPSGADGIGSWDDFEDLVRLAELPNVTVKVSSAPNYSSDPYPYADIHPYLRRLSESFGPQRLMWGTDLTRLRGSYRDCVRLITEALPFLSDDDKEWIMGKTLAQTLNWPETALAAV